MARLVPPVLRTGITELRNLGIVMNNVNNVAWTIDSIAIFFRSKANNNNNKLYVIYQERYLVTPKAER